MNSRQRSFYWKIGYVAGICVLVLVLHWLGRPATIGSTEGKGSPGGVLARLRAEHGLSEAALGEIDPASETMKLATLGMRGVAVNILWTKAHEFKMKKDWTNLSATLEQIAKLQPHFISVWKFQGWNLSYNCSVEFDDYRDRYRWVIKGINFLRDGISYNQFEPRLYWDQGWFTSNKIGKADEKVQYRRLFREDDDYHASLPLELRDPTRDNWLCGKQCFLKAIRLDTEGHEMKGMGDLIFLSDPGMCQINYAKALASDGIFGEVAQQAWARAAREWHASEGSFGSSEVETTFRDPRTGETLVIRLNDKESFIEEAESLEAELDALAPGLRDKLREEKRATLSDEERAALDVPEAQRTTDEVAAALAARRKLEVSVDEVAQRVTGKDRPKALKLARDARLARQMASYINRYRDIVNFEYWRLRCETEQTDMALAAREYIYEADQAAHLDLIAAKENYEKGLAEYRKLLDAFPELLEDEVTGEELVEVIDNYKRHLRRLEEYLPADFILQDVLDKHAKEEQ